MLYSRCAEYYFVIEKKSQEFANIIISLCLRVGDFLGLVCIVLHGVQLEAAVTSYIGTALIYGRAP